jgi:hypothetical protein
LDATWGGFSFGECPGKWVRNDNIRPFADFPEIGDDVGHGRE